MNYALIGCGRIAPSHIKAALDNGIRLVAVCDLLPECAKALLSEFGLLDIPIYTDYMKMLYGHPEIELVAVATSSGAHAEIAKNCIRAGKNVIIEKPVAMSIADANEIIRLGDEYGTVVSACHQNRFNTAVLQTRAALQAGRFGRLSHGSINVRWRREKDYYSQAEWRGTWAQDGGCLMNQCIHGIDLLRWLMGGEIDTVYGVSRRSQHPYIQCEDIGMAVVTFKNGAIATVEGTVNVFPDNLEETLYLFGESGTVKLGGLCANTVDIWKFADDNGRDNLNRDATEQIKSVYGNGHTSLYADVIGAIETGKKPFVGAEAGRDALELVLAIYKSASEGRAVKLPLEDCSTLDFSGMFDF